MEDKRPTKQLPKVTQSNHLVEASYRLELIEKRVILCLLSKIDPRKPLPKKLHLDANEYASLTGTNMKIAYRDLKQGALGLVGQVIRTSDVDRKKGRHQNWMDYVDYFDREGRIEANFSESIKPYISLLAKRFTTIGIEDVAKFKSFYAIRFYELMMQYRQFERRRFDLEELRDILQISSTQYEKFADFRKRVLEPALKEISEKSAYNVSWEKIADGRRVVGVEVVFEAKQQLALALS